VTSAIATTSSVMRTARVPLASSNAQLPSLALYLRG
jgi:hypothetical protein